MSASSGMGWCYLRGSVWYIGYHFQGERRRESSHSTRRGDALKLLRKRQAEMGRGRLVGPDAERTTFEDLAAMVRNDYRNNDRKSTARMEQALTRLSDWFGASRALDITTDQIAVFIRGRQEGRPGPGRAVRAMQEKREQADPSHTARRRRPRPERPARPATIKYELSILKRMFTLGIQAGQVDHRPYVPAIEVRNTRTGFFEAADLTAVLGHLPDELRPIARFSYLTGWRKSEVLSLTWKQVDFEAGTVRLEPGTTKNDEGRTFPFVVFPALADLLRRQWDATTTQELATGRTIPWVFHRQGRPIKDFRAAWKKACTAAGLGDRLVHDLRRTAVRNLERAGVSRSVAMKLTGHKTEAVYRRYAIVSESDLSEGVKKLASLHREAAPAPLRPQLAGVTGSGVADETS